MKTFNYTKVLCKTEVLRCFVSKKLQLTDGGMLVCKAVSEKVTRFDETQQAGTASVFSKVNADVQTF